MEQVVQYALTEDVGVITVDHPPVNALSRDVRAGLLEALQQGLDDNEARALVVVGAGRTFIAGADIREFGKPPAEPVLRDVIAAYERSSKPVIAAIHGTALGGGLEIALGCNYRVAVPSAKVGLPEVKLGLLPGAGGTQRLPRLVGARKALELITTGDFVAAPQAQELGIIDEVIDVDSPQEAGLQFARRAVDEGLPLKRVRDSDDKIAADHGDSSVFDAFRERLEQRAPGLFSPFRCVDAVEAAVTLPFDEGLERERELFVECMDSPQSKGLIHAFFAERESGKIPDVPKDTPVREVKRAAVIGAGTMGGGIAMCFANAGIPVTVLEVSQDGLDRGLEKVRGNYASTVKKGRMSDSELERRMGLIAGTLSYDELRDADIVVEAVFEAMELKEKIFSELDRVCKPGAILASNTSSLDINAIAAVTGRPEDVIGTHFFSPANVMKLLEVVRGERTSHEVLATVMKLGKTLRKVAVPVGVCDGFVGNRMIFQYGREAELLLEEGALPTQVDRVLTDFGMPMGPFAMRDLAGLDVGWRIRKRQRQELSADYPLPAVLDKLCEAGRFGQKTGAGYYRYEEGSRKPIPDPDVDRLVETTSQEKGIERQTLSDDYILQRCLYALINEGAKILEEGVAQRSGDIDVIYIYGYGFPAYRGGPMFYADQVGLDQVYEQVKVFHERLGAWWKPAPLLERLAREGGSFSEYQRS